MPLNVENLPNATGGVYRGTPMKLKDNCCNEIDCSDDERTKNFFLAITNHHHTCFRRLLGQRVDIANIRDTKNNYSALNFALYCSNSYALTYFLQKGLFENSDINWDVCNYLHNNYANTVECMEVLAEFKMISEEQINEFLSHATLMPDKLMLEFLKRGFLLSLKSPVFFVKVVEPNVLSELFDSFIKVDEYKDITIDYSNFYKNHFEAGITIATQMEIIEAIGSRRANKKLFGHPVINIFLDFKWRELSRLFHLNFWLYIFFVCSCVPYILLKLHNSEDWINIFCFFTALGVIYLMVRECLQLAMDYKQYLWDPWNYMEWAMIGLVIALCVNHTFDKYTLNWMCSLTILLLSSELLQMLAYMPTLSLALRMHMFQMVMKSFLKNFVFYSLFVAAFGLCFYIMIGLNGEPKESGLNGFNSTVNVILKCTALMIGELDASEMEFHDTFSIVLFLAFIYVVTIVLFNLINGTAISDVLEIEKDAKINEALQRLKFLAAMDLHYKAWQKLHFLNDNCIVRNSQRLILDKVKIYTNTGEATAFFRFPTTQDETHHAPNTLTRGLSQEATDSRTNIDSAEDVVELDPQETEAFIHHQTQHATTDGTSDNDEVGVEVEEIVDNDNEETVGESEPPASPAETETFTHDQTHRILNTITSKLRDVAKPFRTCINNGNADDFIEIELETFKRDRHNIGPGFFVCDPIVLDDRTTQCVKDIAKKSQNMKDDREQARNKMRMVIEETLALFYLRTRNGSLPNIEWN
ncbi:transient receptor potential cation channel protein painless [Stomoxys calcitrans]|uniref:transient receptor potential cation channel protein painless n=1 Tax=Stomoxys calcitrans TaxID=35570 RepID=UPI0027E23391|nr:transient receptor potential cation channel protein painless [Stomoxys calcitrans]